MFHFKYLIIGGGMAADAAVRGIRQADPDGSIGLIGAEPDPPYDRPPLSKGLWRGQRVEKIWRKTEDQGVELHLGRRAVSLDPAGKKVRDAGGTVYGFEKLLLATGGAPRRLPQGPEGMIYFRTLEDYRRLRELAGERRTVAVIGGGFIGSEIAAALAMNDTRVAMLFPEAGIGARIFPPDLARFVNEYYRERGVEVKAGEMVSRVSRDGESWTVKTKSGATVKADGVVAGLGIRPETSLAEEAGLPVEDGIVVHEGLTAGHADIFAAGDVARFHDPTLGARVRVEHEDNANTMGMAEGRAMAGEGEPYVHTPFFYSDLFDVGYQAVGDTDARLETVEDWAEPYRKGVVYYVRHGRVRGVLLWNLWTRMKAARELLAEPGPFRPAELKGRIPTE